MATATQDAAVGEEIVVRGDIGQSLMAVAYLRMENDGLLDTVFFQHIPTLKEFIGWLESPTNRYLGCFLRRESGEPVLAGIGWLWNLRGMPGGRLADCGICTFREFWHDHLPEKMTAQLLDYSFWVEKLDILYGLSLAENRAVLIHAKRMGMTLLPRLPKFASHHGQPADCVMSFISKEDWLKRRYELSRV
jgi:RimJ/RimL family protein N-acetyltransferase